MRSFYCRTCSKQLHPLGIARHRAMHRDKKEYCEIRTPMGQIWIYRFDEDKQNAGKH